MLKSDTKIYFVGLTGSKLLNINIDNSDTDYIIYANKPKNIFQQRTWPAGIDVICYKPEIIFHEIFINQRHLNAWHIMGGLFSPPIIETPFSSYLNQNAELLISSNLNRFGQVIKTYVQEIVDSIDFEKYPEHSSVKRIGYALVFSDLYIRYALENKSMRELFLNINKELQEFIVNMRNLKIPKDIYLQRLQTNIEKMQEVSEFYNQEPDMVTFNRIRDEVKILLDL